MREQVLQERVRAGLVGLAGSPIGPEDARGAVRRARTAAGRRRHQTTVFLAAAAVAIMLMGAGAVRLLLPAPGVATSLVSSPISSWPARGDQTSNTSLITAAEKLWRSDAPAGQRPGSPVTTLYAGDGKDFSGTVVMLLSTQGDKAVVGIVSTVVNLSGPPQPNSPLVLRSVVSVDPVHTIRSVGFLAAGTPADRPSADMVDSLGYVLLAPGVTSGQVQSSMIDSIETDVKELPHTSSGLLGFKGVQGAGPWNSWVLTPKGTPGVDVLGGAVGDPSYTSGDVDSTGTVITNDGTPVHAGDLVVAQDNRPGGNGFLGVITSSGGGEAKIDPSLTGLARWKLNAVSVISNYRGAFSRTVDGGLIFTTEKVQAPDGVSRVVVTTADGHVTLNAGNYYDPANPERPNTTSPFPIKQSNTLPKTGTTPVWIIATGR